MDVYLEQAVLSVILIQMDVVMSETPWYECTVVLSGVPDSVT